MDTLNLVKQVLLSVLARRKKWIALGFLLGVAVFAPLAWMMSKEPPRFRTSALIVIEPKPDRTPLFPEFSPMQPLDVQLAILRSRSLAEAVVEALPRASVEDLTENPYSRDWALDVQNFVRRLKGEEVVVESPQRRALAELQRARVRFTQQGRSGIVSVQAEASRPRVALDIANTYIEVLLARTRSFNVDDSKVTREYLEQQQAQVNQALNAAEAALRQFTIAQGGVKPPSRNAETVGRLSRIEQQLAEIQANRNMSQNRLAAMKAKLESMPASVAAPAPAPRQPAPPQATSARVQLLRGRLAGLEKQLLEYEAVYTEKHPRVVLVRQQIEDVKQELGEAVKESPPVAAAAVAPSVPTQDRQAFAETVAALETSVQALSAQEEALKEQAAKLRASLSGLSRDELEYTRLVTEVESNRRLSTMLSEKVTAARMKEQGEMKAVKVIDPPHLPYPAANQKRIQFLALAVLLAVVVGVGIPGVVEYFNRPIESEHDVRQVTGLPVLASLPRIRSRRPVFLSSGGQADDLRPEEYFLFTEAFRRLRVELQLLGREMPLRRILVASALPGEGKSTVVVNLGLAFGEVGKHVIIADADFHRPTLHRTLRTPNTRGFSDLLAGTGEVREAMAPVAEGVWLTPRGASSTALSRSSLGSERLGQVLARMSEEADYVILDSSPTLLIPDNLYMAAAVDGVILVVLAGMTRPRDLLRTREVFDKSGTPVLGVVLNQLPMGRLKQYQTYYKYYRSYVKQDARA